MLTGKKLQDQLIAKREEIAGELGGITPYNFQTKINDLFRTSQGANLTVTNVAKYLKQQFPGNTKLLNQQTAIGILSRYAISTEVEAPAAQKSAATARRESVTKQPVKVTPAVNQGQGKRGSVVAAPTTSPSVTITTTPDTRATPSPAKREFEPGTVGWYINRWFSVLPNQNNISQVGSGILDKYMQLVTGRPEVDKMEAFAKAATEGLGGDYDKIFAIVNEEYRRAWRELNPQKREEQPPERPVFYEEAVRPQHSEAQLDDMFEDLLSRTSAIPTPTPSVPAERSGVDVPAIEEGSLAWYARYWYAELGKEFTLNKDASELILKYFAKLTELEKAGQVSWEQKEKAFADVVVELYGFNNELVLAAIKIGTARARNALRSRESGAAAAPQYPALDDAGLDRIFNELVETHPLSSNPLVAQDFGDQDEFMRMGADALRKEEQEEQEGGDKLRGLPGQPEPMPIVDPKIFTKRDSVNMAKGIGISSLTGDKLEDSIAHVSQGQHLSVEELAKGVAKDLKQVGIKVEPKKIESALNKVNRSRRASTTDADKKPTQSGNQGRRSTALGLKSAMQPTKSEAVKSAAVVEPVKKGRTKDEVLAEVAKTAQEWRLNVQAVRSLYEGEIDNHVQDGIVKEDTFYDVLNPSLLHLQRGIPFANRNKFNPDKVKEIVVRIYNADPQKNLKGIADKIDKEFEKLEHLLKQADLLHQKIGLPFAQARQIDPDVVKEVIRNTYLGQSKKNYLFDIETQVKEALLEIEQPLEFHLKQGAERLVKLWEMDKSEVDSACAEAAKQFNNGKPVSIRDFEEAVEPLLFNIRLGIPFAKENGLDPEKVKAAIKDVYDASVFLNFANRNLKKIERAIEEELQHLKNIAVIHKLAPSLAKGLDLPEETVRLVIEQAYRTAEVVGGLDSSDLVRIVANTVQGFTEKVKDKDVTRIIVETFKENQKDYQEQLGLDLGAGADFDAQFEQELAMLRSVERDINAAMALVGAFSNRKSYNPTLTLDEVHYDEIAQAMGQGFDAKKVKVIVDNFDELYRFKDLIDSAMQELSINESKINEEGNLDRILKECRKIAALRELEIDKSEADKDDNPKRIAEKMEEYNAVYSDALIPYIAAIVGRSKEINSLSQYLGLVEKLERDFEEVDDIAEGLESALDNVEHARANREEELFAVRIGVQGVAQQLGVGVEKPPVNYKGMDENRDELAKALAQKLGIDADKVRNSIIQVDELRLLEAGGKEPNEATQRLKRDKYREALKGALYYTIVENDLNAVVATILAINAQNLPLDQHKEALKAAFKDKVKDKDLDAVADAIVEAEARKLKGKAYRDAIAAAMGYKSKENINDALTGANTEFEAYVSQLEEAQNPERSIKIIVQNMGNIRSQIADLQAALAAARAQQGAQVQAKQAAPEMPKPTMGGEHIIVAGAESPQVDVDEMQARIAELEADLLAALTAQERAESANAEQQEAFDSHERTLSSQIEEANKAKDAAEKENERLKRDAAEAGEKSRQEREAVASREHGLQNELSKVSAERDANKKSAIKLELQNDALEQANRAMAAQLEKNKEEEDEQLEADLLDKHGKEELETLKLAAQAARDELERAKAAHEAALHELQKKNEAEKAELARRIEGLAGAEQAQKKRDDGVGAVSLAQVESGAAKTDELASLRRQLSEMEVAHSEALDELRRQHEEAQAVLRTQLQQKDAEQVQVVQITQENEAEKLRLTQELARLTAVFEQSKAALQEEARKANEAKAQLQREVEELQEQKRGLEAAGSVAASLESLNTQLAEKQTALRAANEKVEELTEKLKALHSEHEQALATNDAAIKAQESALEALKMRVARVKAEAETELARLREQTEAVQKDILAKQQALQELSGSDAEKAAARQQLEADLVAKRRELAGLNSQEAAIRDRIAAATKWEISLQARELEFTSKEQDLAQREAELAKKLAALEGKGNQEEIARLTAELKRTKELLDSAEESRAVAIRLGGERSITIDIQAKQLKAAKENAASNLQTSMRAEGELRNLKTRVRELEAAAAESAKRSQGDQVKDKAMKDARRGVVKEKGVELFGMEQDLRKARERIRELEDQLQRQPQPHVVAGETPDQGKTVGGKQEDLTELTKQKRTLEEEIARLQADKKRLEEGRAKPGRLPVNAPFPVGGAPVITRGEQWRIIGFHPTSNMNPYEAHVAYTIKLVLGERQTDYIGMARQMGLPEDSLLRIVQHMMVNQVAQHLAERGEVPSAENISALIPQEKLPGFENVQDEQIFGIVEHFLSPDRVSQISKKEYLKIMQFMREAALSYGQPVSVGEVLVPDEKALKQLREEFELKKQQFEERVRELEAQIAQHKGTAEELEAVRAELARVKKSAEQSQQDYDAIEALRARNKKLEVLEATILERQAEMAQRLSAQTAEIRSLRKQLAAAEKDAQGKENATIAGLRGELEKALRLTEAIKQELDAMSAQNAELVKRIEAERAEALAKLRAAQDEQEQVKMQLATAQTDNARALQIAQDGFVQQKEALNLQYTQAIAGLQSGQVQELQQTQIRYSRRLSELEQQHAANIAAINQRHADALKELTNAHRAALVKQFSAFHVMAQNYEEALLMLRSQKSALDTQVKEISEELEVAKAEHIQDAQKIGSLTASLQQVSQKAEETAQLLTKVQSDNLQLQMQLTKKSEEAVQQEQAALSKMDETSRLFEAAKNRYAEDLAGVKQVYDQALAVQREGYEREKAELARRIVQLELEGSKDALQAQRALAELEQWYKVEVAQAGLKYASAVAGIKVGADNNFAALRLTYQNTEAQHGIAVAEISDVGQQQDMLIQSQLAMLGKFRGPNPSEAELLEQSDSISGVGQNMRSMMRPQITRALWLVAEAGNLEKRSLDSDSELKRQVIALRAANEDFERQNQELTKALSQKSIDATEKERHDQELIRRLEESHRSSQRLRAENDALHQLLALRRRQHAVTLGLAQASGMQQFGTAGNASSITGSYNTNNVYNYYYPTPFTSGGVLQPQGPAVAPSPFGITGALPPAYGAWGAPNPSYGAGVPYAQPAFATPVQIAQPVLTAQPVSTGVTGPTVTIDDQSKKEVVIRTTEREEISGRAPTKRITNLGSVASVLALVGIFAMLLWFPGSVVVAPIATAVMLGSACALAGFAAKNAMNNKFGNWMADHPNLMKSVGFGAVVLGCLMIAASGFGPVSMIGLAFIGLGAEEAVRRPELSPADWEKQQARKEQVLAQAEEARQLQLAQAQQVNPPAIPQLNPVVTPPYNVASTALPASLPHASHAPRTMPPHPHPRPAQLSSPRASGGKGHVPPPPPPSRS